MDAEASTDGYVLTSDGAGNAAWEVAPGAGGGISNVVEDLTPQLGGDLDVNGKDITYAGNWEIRATVGYLNIHGESGVRFYQNSTLDLWFAMTTAGAYVPDGRWFRVQDSSNSDYMQIAHDGTDVNITHFQTTDWNISGITSIQAGAVDADFDAITATSYGGITEANLVDKSAAEVITGAWSVPSTINTQNGDYTLVLGDAGKTIHKASGGAGHTITIPANASVAFPTGVLIAIENDGGAALTVAITTDTLTWSADNTTGSRTIADGGCLVIQKMTATTWKCAGNQVT